MCVRSSRVTSTRACDANLEVADVQVEQLHVIVTLVGRPNTTVPRLVRGRGSASARVRVRGRERAPPEP
eukprot:scaffold124178_cov39-Phaeocystis_antarctica.AAC.1